MATNDVVLLDSLIARHAPRYGAGVEASELFELFVFDQLLKRYDPTYAELESGSVDGGNDGGIDGFFVYVDGRPTTDDVEKTAALQSPALDVIIITARSSPRFQQQPVDALNGSLSELLDLTKQVEDLQYPYNSHVLRQRRRFERTYVDLVERRPKLDLSIHYCSRGDTAHVAPNIRARASSLEGMVRTLFGTGKAVFRFHGASELLELARRRPDRSLRLPFTESYISREGQDFVVLVPLTDYLEFVTDENGDLRRYLFDSNVRDYLGKGAVNRDIAATLSQDRPSAAVEDFWWLNNGVTMLCTDVAVAGKALSIENVQIINGLQTTETLYQTFRRRRGRAGDDRAILVKIIAAADDDVRARIIKATNYQCAVDLSSLRGLDKIQRDIEQYLEDHGWFYDRRRNYFKNQGKPADRIVAVAYLASAIRAVALGDPASSQRKRARALRVDKVYSAVFDPNWDLKVFLVSLEIVHAVDVALQSQRTRKARSHLAQPPIRSVHFIAYVYVCLRLGKTSYKPSEIIACGDDLPTVPVVLDLQSRLRAFHRRHGVSKKEAYSAPIVERFLRKSLRESREAAAKG